MLLSLRSLWEQKPPVEGTSDATLQVTGAASGTFTEVELDAIQGGGQAFVSLTAEAAGELYATGVAQAFIELTAEAVGSLTPSGRAEAVIGLEAAAEAVRGVVGTAGIVVKVTAESSGLGEPLDPIFGEGFATISEMVGSAVGTGVPQDIEPDLPDTGGFRIRRPGFVSLKRPIRGEAKAKIAAVSAAASGTIGVAGRAEVSIEIEASAYGVRGINGRVDGVVVPLMAQAKGEALRWSDQELEILMLLAEAA